MTADKIESHPPTTSGHTVPGDMVGPRAAQSVSRPAVARSRMGGLWLAAIAFALVLLLLMIFVLQNGQSAEVSFLGAHGNLPMGVALLLAAIFGVLLVAVPGTARIMQLRIRGRVRPTPVAEARHGQHIPASVTPPSSVRSASPPGRTGD
jgi:uncharacterized integral membrane protein